MSKAWSGPLAFILVAYAALGCGSATTTSSSTDGGTPGETGVPPIDAGDSPSVGCTLVGCGDSATITLQSPTGSWSAGTYVFDLNADGMMSMCSLQVPAAPSGTSLLSGSCPPGISLFFQAMTHCMMIDSGVAGISGAECTPVPGQFYMQLSIMGTPQHVSIAIALNGSQLANDSLNLSYQSVSPNGPSCGPTCQGASAELTVPSPNLDGGCCSTCQCALPAGDGGTVNLSVAGLDMSCHANSDCVLVPIGQWSATDPCCGHACPGGAINASAQSQYNSTASQTLMQCMPPGATSCGIDCVMASAYCDGGTCAVCAGTSCAGDAG